MCTSIQQAPNAEPKQVCEKTVCAAPGWGVESPPELPSSQGCAWGEGLSSSYAGDMLAQACTIKGFLSTDELLHSSHIRHELMVSVTHQAGFHYFTVENVYLEFSLKNHEQAAQTC